MEFSFFVNMSVGFVGYESVVHHALVMVRGDLVTEMATVEVHEEEVILVTREELLLIISLHSG